MCVCVTIYSGIVASACALRVYSGGVLAGGAPSLLEERRGGVR